MRAARAPRLAALALATLLAHPAAALPPLETVREQLESARSRVGDELAVEGHLSWGPLAAEPVSLDVERGRGATIRVGDSSTAPTLRAEWGAEDQDLVLRLLGVALAARDLEEAVRALGRTVEPTVQTLAFLPPPPDAIGAEATLVYVLGGPLDARAARLYVARDSYLLLGIDFPAPEGVYELRSTDFSLAGGWFPARVRIARDGRVLLDLRMERAE